MRASLAFAGLLLVLLSACHRRPSAAADSREPEAPPLRVATAVVEAGPANVALEVSGTVQAVKRAVIAARVSGTITDLPLTLGQRVRRGEVLVTIASADLAARELQAQTRLKALRLDLARERTLLEKGASARESVRAIEDQVVAAEAAVREAQALAADASIPAPFDGVITQRLANVGDLASPGLPLVELQGDADFEIEAAVPEAASSRVRVGDPVPVRLPSSGATFTAAVVEFSAAADPRLRAHTIKLRVPRGAAVRGGQFARLDLPGEPRPLIRVPAAAVSRLGQMDRVFVVSPDSRARQRIVRTGPRLGPDLEILAGLSAGERVLVAPPADLREGRRVEFEP